jgi:hypothetical protein
MSGIARINTEQADATDARALVCLWSHWPRRAKPWIARKKVFRADAARIIGFFIKCWKKQ